MSENNGHAPDLPAALRAALEGLPPDERRDLERAWMAAAAFGAEGPSPETVQSFRAADWEAVRRATEPAASVSTDAPAEAPAGARAPADARRVRHRAAYDRPAMTPWRRPPYFWATAIAAVAVVIVMVTMLLLNRLQTVHAPLGEQVAVTLSDGSAVTLNAGASLEHPRRFRGAERTVRLEGEAFFEVATQDEPFTVETFNATVTVLGTRFNVRAWPEETDSRTEVAVESGRVRVEGTDASGHVVLQAGEASVVGSAASAPTPPQPASVADAASWRERDFILTNRPVAVVLDEIRRRFAVDVVVADPAVLADTISLIVPAPANVDTLLQDVAQYLGSRLEKTPDAYILRTP